MPVSGSVGRGYAPWHGALLSTTSPLEKAGRERKPGAINVSPSLCFSIPLDNLRLLT